MSVNLDLLASLTENMFSLPIEKFSEFFYNGKEVENAVDLTGCETFANYSTAFQTVEIYADKQVIYSCSVSQIYDVPVITHVYEKCELVYQADYGELYNEMSANVDIVKAYRINTLCEKIEKAFTAAEKAINDTDGNGILLAYTNYMYNIGLFHAYMDSLDTLDFEKWSEVYGCYVERLRHMETKSDDLYCSLKKTIYGNVYA